MGTEAVETYEEQFYDEVREGAKRSAEVIVPLLMERKPETVVDVGCGEGWFGKAFEDAGCTVVGVDGPWVTDCQVKQVVHDLAKPLPDIGTYDLVVCLEVAEHLPESRASDFVDELCTLAEVILFSAAIPGQGGTGHVNEQTPVYWTRRFAGNGYTCSAALKWRLWNNPLVENWYAQNLLVCAEDPDRFPEWFDTPLAEVFHVVHPVLLEARIAERDGLQEHVDRSRDRKQHG